ncbi:MAG: glycosyltransferase [Magnetospirillum sp.]|nr:glycosyltransferase [Magnetospirillum sp.]
MTDALWPTLILAGLAVLLLPSLDPHRAVARVVVLSFAAAAMGRYLVWRIAETLPDLSLDPAALWMWAMAGVEGLALLNGIVTVLVLLRRSDRRAAADAGAARLARTETLPAVDVVVPTYAEPAEVIERTLVGALALDWPDARVWVLDDGSRPWLAELCAARGVRYLARTERAGGKAGNINAWLAASGGEAAPYAMVLDADFIPQRRFLTRVMGLFADDGVALVQTPQSFFNPDPIQRNLACGTAFADEQRFFYHVFQPSLDAWGASFCCGTSFVVRRDRLDAIGGVPTCTVTEDMMTTYALAARGWRTIYLDEPLSAGMAPEGLPEFINQRGRWCLGTVQALFSPLNPLRQPVGWGHRLCFLNAQLYWLASVPLMLLAAVAPAVTWWTGVPPFLADADTFMGQFGPRFVAEAAAMSWVSRGAIVPVLSGLGALLSAPAAGAAALAALLQPGGQAFRATVKGGDRAGVVVHGRMAAWLLVLMAAIAGGIVVNQSPELAVLPHGAALLNLAWSAAALAFLFLGLLVCVELPRRRRHDRLPLGETVGLEADGVHLEADLTDLSVGGAAVRCADGPAAGPVVVEIAGIGALAAEVVRRQGALLSLRFIDAEGRRDALIRKLYTGPAALPGNTLDPWAALSRAVRRPFTAD